MASRRPTKSAGPPSFTADMRVVVLHGKESFLRSEYTRHLVAALNERHGEVQVFEIDGESAQAAEVLDELRSYSLLQQHKLVIVDHADEFLSAGRGGDEGSKPKGSPIRSLMERYAEAPVEDATLLLRASTWRKGKLDKAIEAQGGVIVKCEEVNSATAAKWCRGRCQKRYAAELAPDAAALLVERVGTDLNRLDMEVMKLATAAGEGSVISRHLVIDMVGMSREDVAWSIQEAIASGHPARAVTKLWELLTISRVAIEPLSWSMVELTRKLYAASEMMDQGVPAPQISKALKLWGPSQNVILGTARGVPTRELAQLLQRTIETDRSNKRGLGRRERNLEAQSILVADTIGSGSR